MGNKAHDKRKAKREKQKSQQEQLEKEVKQAKRMRQSSTLGAVLGDSASPLYSLRKKLREAELKRDVAVEDQKRKREGLTIRYKKGKK